MFKIAGGTRANSIAKWDGQNWHSLGEGFENGFNRGGINTILVDGNDVYVGGYFDHAGHTAASNLARWDGAEWHEVGGGTGADLDGSEERDAVEPWKHASAETES